MKSLSRKTVSYSLAIGLLLALSLVSLIRIYVFASNPPDGNIAIRYLVSVENKTNLPVTNASISINGPVDHTATQRCRTIQTSHPHTMIKDALGNQHLYFQWKIFPPLTTKLVSIHGGIQIWNEPRDVRIKDVKAFLEPEPYIESDDKKIQQQAAELKARTPLLTAEKINDWVAGNIDYSGYVSRNLGAAYALKHRKGDCTEYSFLFVALCRANGIPARPMAGFVCPQSMVVDFGDYHNWAEFYLDGRWHIADPQNKRFMSDQPYYIAFQIIRPSEGLNGFLLDRPEAQGLEVKIKPRASGPISK
jgi:transglutaminase-like putative cysteine protease